MIYLAPKSTDESRVLYSPGMCTGYTATHMTQQPNNRCKHTTDIVNISTIDKHSLESPSMIIGYTFYQIKFCSRCTTNWPVPAITNAAVYITVVETLKAAV